MSYYVFTMLCTIQNLYYSSILSNVYAFEFHWSYCKIWFSFQICVSSTTYMQIETVIIYKHSDHLIFLLHCLLCEKRDCFFCYLKTLRIAPEWKTDFLRTTTTAGSLENVSTHRFISKLAFTPETSRRKMHRFSVSCFIIQKSPGWPHDMCCIACALHSTSPKTRRDRARHEIQGDLLLYRSKSLACVVVAFLPSSGGELENSGNHSGGFNPARSI